jgi:AraC-like DNA-binding protein
MDMQTGKNDVISNAQNFGVIALQRRVFARSNIAVMFVNKQTLDYQSVTDTKNISEYNRNIGVEYNILSKNNAWTGKLLYLKSFTPSTKPNDGVLAGNILYTNKRWTAGLQMEQVGNNYSAEVGYVPRLNYGKLNPQMGYLFFPKSSKKVLSHGPTTMFTHYFLHDFSKETENESMDGIFLRQAIAVVEENLANFDFTHEQLIDAMNTSKSTLYRKIKSLTGLSPSEFVRNIRLKHACIMLKNETGNVSDIAYAVGFNDPKYFSTCFKAEFGVTPREYNKLKTE